MTDRRSAEPASAEVRPQADGERTSAHQRGMWGMHCWNGLSAEQAEFLRTEGYLPIFTAPQGECLSGAEVEVTTMYDKFPGPRFYCLPCAVEYLTQLTPSDTRHTPQTGCGLCE